jgi:hypothetical protein
VLQAGLIGPLGLGMSELSLLRSLGSDDPAASAKSVIFVF